MAESEDFLINIEYAIECKYKIFTPIFFYNFEQLPDRTKIIAWINDILRQGRIVKYKHLSDNKFELKDFLSDPGIQVREKLIADFIKNAETYSLKKFGTTDFMIGVYTKDEVKHELMALLYGRKAGLSLEGGKIFEEKNGAKYVLLWPWEYQREIDVDILDGFLVLENTY